MTVYVVILLVTLFLVINQLLKQSHSQMTSKMVATYTANPTRETVDALAKELGKNTRSVIAKLSREGVYKAQPRTTKTGEPIVRKAELLTAIESHYGIELPSLVKASKADLQRLIDTIG